MPEVLIQSSIKAQIIYYHNLTQEGIWKLLKKKYYCRLYEKTAEIRQFMLRNNISFF
jgi:hypothetical protein